ncbi:hypothetical protein WEH80_07655 [Actinomycetes bacterium KLBMP 9759]
METTNTTGWWNCLGCGVEAELAGAEPAGCEVPCPDCGAPMTQWRQWETAA